MIADRQSVLLRIGATIEQYQRLATETTLLPCDRGDRGRSAARRLGVLEGWGWPPIPSAAPRRGRGVNSGVEPSAGNSRTRFPSQTPGPDFSFSAEYSGGCHVRNVDPTRER